VRAFQAVTTGVYGKVTLWSCRINGEPSVAIMLADHVGEGKVGVMPLFVAITPGMQVTFEGEQGGEGGGGPQRECPDATRRRAGSPARVSRVRARFNRLGLMRQRRSRTRRMGVF
jgi:hypothetical protein